MDFLFTRSLLTALKFVVMAVPLKLIFALFVSMMRNKAVRGLPVSDEVYEAIEPNLSEGERLGMEMYQAINNDVVTGTPYWADTPSAYTSWVSEFNATGEAIILGEMSEEEGCTYVMTIGQQVASTLQ